MFFFENVKEEALDPILGLIIKFTEDKRKNKVNLGAGIYKTADLKSFILSSVKKAEHNLLANEASKDYLPIDGSPEYVQLTKELVFGKKLLSTHMYGAQTVGGTAALSVGAHFLKEVGLRRIYLSSPTWANHYRVFQDVGFEVKTYPYFSWKKKGFDFPELMQELERMPEQSVVLFQASCHNPTGFDPKMDEWQEIFDKIEQKNIFPFFDLAYQGLGDSIEKDVAILPSFLERGLECAVAVSHAKNFGLYGERCGALFFNCKNGASVKSVGSRIKMIIRGLYSNPPCHGARIVTTVLQDKELMQQWRNELEGMRERISEMRKTLVLSLQVKGSTSHFDFMSAQKGMFSYTGLEENQVERLIAEYGIYLPKDGRINVAGLNSQNIDYVVDAILAVSSL